MQNLTKKIQSTAHQYNLWQKNSKIILGVSGGPDSVCMLDIFSRIKKTYSLELRIVHVNYGLRGKDSERDEKFVRDLASKYGLEIEVLNVAAENNSKVEPLTSRKKSLRLNLKPGSIKMPSENELRNIRYDFFEKIRQDNKFDLIAIAHNLDDQAETFLMRLLRGSGLEGLSAMKYKNASIIRPLLGTTRKEILDYLKKEKLKHRTDKTNKTGLFLRNRVRNNLLPLLEKDFNPNIKKTLFDSTLAIAEDFSLLQELTEKAYPKNGELSVSKLTKLHPALQKRVLLRAIAEKKLDKKDVRSSHIEEILKVINSTKGKNQVVVFKGLKMTRKGDRVTISKL